jgi:hypothetical protein
LYPNACHLFGTETLYHFNISREMFEHVGNL